MPDRSVVVRLRAEIAGFKQSMADAAKAVRGIGSSGADAEEQTQGLIDRMKESAEEHQQAWSDIGKTMLVAGGVIGAGVGLAVKSFADFDQKMSMVKAVSGASADEMKRLSAAALKAGADTKYSASQAAEATGELAKVGISTSDILGGALTGSLNLAAAGNLDLADAAQISGQAMKLFGLQGKDVGHIADVLAAGANKSAADVTDLAQALSQGGLVAAQTGLNLDQTVGTLSAFADNALMGSDAGTSFKTMLQRLNPQSAQAQQLMDQLGLSAYDAQGNFVGITAYAGKLQDALGKMSVEQRNAAMQTLFGSDAVRAATVLYNLGAKGVQSYVDAVDDQGAAARVAAINMDNLAGDIEQLKGSIDTGLTQAGAGANDVLRALVESGTATVNFVNNLPGPLIKVGLGFAAVTSAALITGGAVMTLSAKAAATRATMVELGLTSQATAARMTTAAKGAGILAAAIVGVTAAGAGFDTFIGRQAAGLNEAGQSLLAFSKAGRDAKGVTDLTSSGFKDLDKSINLALRSGAWSATKEFFADFATLSIVPTGMDEAKEFFKEVDSGLSNLVSSGHADEAQKVFDQVAAAAQKQGFSIAQVNDLLPSYASALASAQAAAQGAVPPTEQLGGSINGVQVSAKDAADAVDKLVQSLADAGLVQLSSRDAVRQYKQSLDDAAAALKKNGETLNLNTQKGRDNQAALDGVAQATIRSAQATYERVKATDGVGPAEAAFRATLTKSRGALVTTAEKFGMSKTEAKRYADQVLNIPAVRNTKVTLSGAAAAITAAGQIAAAIAKIPGRKTTDVVVRKIGAQNDALTRADGGRIPLGLGGPREDNVLIAASAGEFVVNAESTAKHLALIKAINADRFANGGLVGYATGGQVAGANADFARLFGSKDLGAQVVQAFADGMNGGKGAVKSVAEQIRSIVSDNAKKASDDLKSLLDDQASYAKQVGGSFLSAGSLTDATERGKSFTVGPDGQMVENTPSPFADQLTSAIGQTKGFEDTISRLAKLGARTDVLQQFLDKGPDAADAAAALAALGKSGVSNVNRLQGQLVAATSSLGSLGASAVYGPRVQAARAQVVDAKAMEVAVTKATAPQSAELKKITAEGRKTNSELAALRQRVESFVNAVPGVQNAARNATGRR